MAFLMNTGRDSVDLIDWTYGQVIFLMFFQLMGDTQDFMSAKPDNVRREVLIRHVKTLPS